MNFKVRFISTAELQNLFRENKVSFISNCRIRIYDTQNLFTERILACGNMKLRLKLLPKIK